MPDDQPTARPPAAAATAETIERMEREVVVARLSEADRRAVSDLLASLAVDMARFKMFDVGASEPAPVYHPDG